jgi:hypothetical protein
MAERPCFGEKVSGDVGMARQNEDWDFFAVVDVLGHGSEAREVAVVAERFLNGIPSPELLSALEGLHQALMGTRGAAAALALRKKGENVVKCLGVGNTTIRVLGRTNQTMTPVEGIIGQQYRSPNIISLKLSPGDYLILHSDGIEGSLNLEALPSARYQGPAAISRSIIREFSKPYDDAVCVVARYAP